MRQELISTRRTQLSANKLSLLEKRLQGKSPTGPLPGQPQPITRAPRDGELPLAYIQENRLVYERRVREATGRSINNHLSRCFSIAGRLDVQTLGDTLGDLSQRHDILRSRFPFADGLPIQVVDPAPVSPLSVIDLRDVPESERRRTAMLHVAERENAPFDSDNESLWRVVLLRLGDDEQLLLLVMHHAISDIWSLEFMVRDMLTLYRARETGAAARLPEPAIQYADFAHWQRRELEGLGFARHIHYWKEQLKGVGPLPNVHFRNMRPASGPVSNRATAQRIGLSPELLESLRGLGRREGCTLYMVILAAVKILLQHCSGEDDIAVRSPVSGRNRPETEGMVGWVANLLVLRTDLSGAETFIDVLRRVRKVVLEAYEHQDIPFVKLVEAFNHCDRWNDDAAPRVILNVTQKGGEQARPPQVEGLRISAVAVPRPEAVTGEGLAIQVVEGERELDVSFTYRVESFEASAVAAMLASLRAIVECAAADPHAQFAALPLALAA